MNKIEISSVCPICDSEIEVVFDPEKDWRLLYTTSEIIDGEMIKANLESAEIPVQLLSQIDSTEKLNLGNLAIVKIFVPYQYMYEAGRIMKTILNESDE
jgi:hypothetical protein